MMNSARFAMVQNHLLQLLCLVAMEPPSKFVADQVRDEKLRVLRALKPITRENFDRCVKLGQYTKGSIKAKPVESYADEEAGIPVPRPSPRCAVNFELALVGCPFLFADGKRLAGRASEIVVTFRRPPHNIFEDGVRGDAEAMEPNRLVIRLQPNEGLKLCMTSKEPGRVACDYSPRA